MLDEHKTAGGQSHFAGFVAGLDDEKDFKDAAVLAAALRSFGNQLREPRSRSLGAGLFELAAPRCGFITGSCPDRVQSWSADMLRNGPITPAKVLGLMRARLKEAQSEYQKPRAGTARKKGR